MKSVLCFCMSVAFTLCIASEGEWPIPEQDKIPVKGYLVAKPYLWIPHINGAECMGGDCQMRVGNELNIDISFNAALSSVEIGDFVERWVNDLKTRKDILGNVIESKDVGRVTKSLSGRTAVVDIEEMVYGSSLIRMRILFVRVRDGFSAVTVSAETKCWMKYELLVRNFLNAVRVMTNQESLLIGDKKFAAVDVEGDVFIPLGVPMRDYERQCMESSRYYFRNETKNRPAISLKERKTEEKARADKTRRETLMKYRVDSLCGYRLGSEMEDDVKYVKTGSGYEVRMPIKVKKPFDVCQSVVLKYTGRGRLLYSISLESNRKVRPLLSKMNARVLEMVKALEAKHGDKLKFVDRDGWHQAEYKGNAEQLFYCGVMQEEESFKNLSGVNRTAKFVVVLEDEDVRMNGYRAECVREDR